MKHAEPKAFYARWGAYIDSILAHPDSVIKLAVLTEDKDVCLGFVAFRSSILDYGYVHADHRRCRIFSRLLPAGIEMTTHLTKDGREIWKKRKWTFNPFA